MRFVIVGGGVIALLTAVNCISAGHAVVLVDQAGIPFSGATSFDRHRVTRALHLNDPAVTRAAVDAHYRWIVLQDMLSTRIYEQVGALSVLPREKLSPAETMLAECGSQARVLDPDDLAAAFPQVEFPAGESAVFESHAGVLLADRILAACAGWLRWHAHADLHPHRRAVEIDVDGAAVRLADGETLRADGVLLAAGPWSRSLLPAELAAELVLYRQSMLYCEVPDRAAWAETPPMLSLGKDGGAWLVPPVAGTPLKLSAASACRQVDEVTDNSTPARWRDHLLDAFSTVIPGFRTDWLTDTRDCYYLARSSTQGPMLAALGERVFSYAACGGSSFKFAPLIAESLAARLTGNVPTPTGIGHLDRPMQFMRGVS
ncbi:glycine/D-amino acid oxidase-like deaminating enzyme [Kibdelosporangium banguiense]|uniref:Glycine/D-amino acid oxidase-like deaminating enzyme n=1 Tax=Kibdelosporangium banguiense TaxID=1365924 RepID=A0ABS4TPQ8_9PSEU|nr:FAD-binding oxidoreductase [Kibdelosporangium banguiense]MBP2326387.1 glycine/D-amino acid oxidase-like deaminating enzyme [Kibdelosporangium banguiense]